MIQTMTSLRVLGFAAAYRRVGYTFLVEGRLMDWRVSEKAARSPVEVAAFAQTWVNELKPDVVVTEKAEKAQKKADGTKELIHAIARTAAQNYLLDVSIERTHGFPSKYEEAAALAERYPEITAWLPDKRVFYENEPRNTVLFEALALAHEVQSGPPTPLAAAMG